MIGLFKRGETIFTEETALMTDVSGKDGAFGFENVPYGNYIVREIKPPVGYLLSDTAYPIVIDGSTVDITVTVENSPKPVPKEPQPPKPEIPKSPPVITGDNTRLLFWLLILGFAACCLCRRFRKGLAS